ncbi:hypothetical protein GCM10010489_19350 [Microbacterium saperdae]|nr:hypothetical protein GCM10010489_19350 [Microbacterium saperdae]
MGWFGRKRDPQDVNETLRRYNEAESSRLAALAAGESGASSYAPVVVSAAVSLGSGAEFSVEDVFTITGRGLVATGHVTDGILREGDAILVLREGSSIGESEIDGIEMFRKRAKEVSSGTMAGLLLRGKVDVARGDVIRVVASA